MKHRGRWGIILAFLLCLTAGLCLFPGAAAAEEKREVRVPLSLEAPHAIAGAEFEIEYTPGLKLIAFEKSEAIASAFTTPIVEKNGKTYLGFYHASNELLPQNGVLDVGYLVFEYSGEPDQSVTVTEAKYVEVVDKDTTTSELFTINEQIAVPLGSAAELRIGKRANHRWIILAASLLVAAAVALLLYRSRRKKPADAPEQDASA